MKKALITILLAASVLLAGCNDSYESIDASTNDESQQTSKSDDGYESIERHDPKSYALETFGFNGDDHVLSLNIPKDWKLSNESSGSYSITRDGKSVASMYMGDSSDGNEWRSVNQQTSLGKDVNIECNIEKKTSNGETSYRYRYTFKYETGQNSRTVTLTADCAEINDFTHRKFMYSPTRTPITNDTSIGMLSSEKNCTNILILGNSFIGSSDIGYILDDMLLQNGKNCYVNAISRGYATVATYISDSYLMSDIKQGYYDIVFICGFYSSSEVSNLGTLKSYCDSSNTTLVIFPAHNESSSVVSSAKSTYSSLPCLNWKAELDMLISNGVDRWDLCTDDAHDHSKPLAGYVGAHMIYRAIYSEVPKEFPVNALYETDVVKILGDYVETGSVENVDITSVYFFD